MSVIFTVCLTVLATTITIVWILFIILDRLLELKQSINETVEYMESDDEGEQPPTYVERSAFVSCKESGCKRNVSPGCCRFESVFYSSDYDPITICAKKVKIVQDPKIIVEVIEEEK